jgi:hypothetical protein
MNELHFFDLVGTVTTADVANDVLADVGTGAAHPDALANRLVELLTAVDTDIRDQIIKEYLRPVQKRLERTNAD